SFIFNDSTTTEIYTLSLHDALPISLYQQSVEELAGLLDNTEGIQRKGLILSFLTRFKQICNHPSQWLSDGAWSEADSGKSDCKRSEEHTSELQSRGHLVCRLLLEKK